MFTVRIDHAPSGDLPMREVFECARYTLVHEQPRNAAVRVTLFGVTGLGDVAGKDILLSSGEAMFVMNARGDTVDSCRTARAGAQQAGAA